MAQKGREWGERRIDALRIVRSKPGMTTCEIKEELDLATNKTVLDHMNFWIKQGLVVSELSSNCSFRWYPVLHQSVMFFVLSKKWDKHLEGFIKNATCCYLDDERQSSPIPSRDNAKTADDMESCHEDIQQAAKSFGRAERCPMGGIGARHKNQCASIFQYSDE